MAESVGEIALDLSVNQSGFGRQMNGIQSLAKKTGVMLASAFAVKKLVDFGKSCLKLGSDLQEVQNIVDVAFPSMSKQIDKFAKNAVNQFGLSETMAKRYSSLFGIMSKQFGFSEKEAYEMGTTLAGLAGDVASFYDIAQDEAYAKLKSVFSGETETLKDIGVVMTQNALDAYAMANGYGKVTANMSEGEKVALRYKFVQDKLISAQGDFARTSNSWANQTRVLALQFDSLRASIGQGLINALTPAIQVLNALMAKLVQVGNAFKNFMTKVFGDAGGGQDTVTKALASDMSSASSAGTELEKSTGKTAKNAKKIEKSVMGFDKLNKLTSNSGDAGSSGTSGGTPSAASTATKSNNNNNNGGKQTNALLDAIGKKVKELKQQFQEGFREGLGKDFNSSLERTKQHINNIGNSLKEIVTDKEVQSSANNLANSFARNLGRVSGSVVSIGATIAENLTGGADKYLVQNKEYIKKRIVETFDAEAETMDIVGKFSTAWTEVFEVFRSPEAKQCTADYIGIFANARLGIVEIVAKIKRDVIGVFLKPFIENKDKAKKALEGMLKPISKILSSVNTFIKDTFSKISQTYDQKLKPMFDKITKAISNLVGTIYDFFNNVLQPYISWFIDTVLPSIQEVAGKIVEVVINFVGEVAEVFGGVFQLLDGIITFITGVFSGNWGQAWEGIKKIFEGIWNAIKGIFVGVIGAIVGAIEAALLVLKGIVQTQMNFIKDIFSKVWNAIKGVVSAIWNEIKGVITTIANTIKNAVSNAWNGIKQVTSTVFNGVKSIVSNVWNGIKGVINSIIGGIEGMANGVVGAVNTIIDAMNGLHFDIPDWVPAMGGKSFGFDIPKIDKVALPRLAQGGFVEKNTPQLALIGDNRHQGEVVAPEDKLYSITSKAVVDAIKPLVVALSGSKSNKKETIELTINLGSKKIARDVALEISKENRRMGRAVYNLT